MNKYLLPWKLYEHTTPGYIDGGIYGWYVRTDLSNRIIASIEPQKIKNKIYYQSIYRNGVGKRWHYLQKYLNIKNAFKHTDKKLIKKGFKLINDKLTVML